MLHDLLSAGGEEKEIGVESTDSPRDFFSHQDVREVKGIFIIPGNAAGEFKEVMERSVIDNMMIVVIAPPEKKFPYYWHVRPPDDDAGVEALSAMIVHIAGN